MNLSSIPFRWAFLAIVLGLYGVGWLASPGLVLASLVAFSRIGTEVLPVLVLVFAMMFAANYLVKPREVARFLGKESGIKGWLIAIAGGILSTGPIYMWYPMLADLRDRGMRPALMAAFLCNRAVKIPLLPLMLLYFGAGFTALVSVLTIAFSVANGMVVERFGGG